MTSLINVQEADLIKLWLLVLINGLLLATIGNKLNTNDKNTVYGTSQKVQKNFKFSQLIDTACLVHGAWSMQRSGLGLSIPSINSRSGVRQVSCSVPCRQEIDWQHPVGTALQCGIQQQMQAVWCWQPRYKADHRLVKTVRLSVNKFRLKIWTTINTAYN